MSIKRFNEFPDGSGVISNDDILLFMDDPSGIASTNKISVSDLKSLMVSDNEEDITQTPGSRQYFVDGSRSDSYTADGTMFRPFKTIQAAVNYAEAEWATDPYGAGTPNAGLGWGVVINILPWDYQESVTLNRAKIHLRGFHPNGDATVFSALRNVTINCTQAMGSIHTTQYILSGLLFIVGNGIGDCIKVQGNVNCRVVVQECQVWTNGVGQRCLHVAHSGAPSVRCDRVVFINNAANFTTIEATTGQLIIVRSSITTGNASSVVFSGSSLAMDNVSIGSAGSEVCVFSGAGTANISNSTITTSRANATGIRLADTVNCTSVKNVFNVPTGSGYAVDGVAGTTLNHALSAFTPNTNKTINPLVSIVSFSVSPNASSDVTYDNTESGLVATNVKAALDELAPKKVYNETQDTYYDTIQAAIDAADNNDIVYVAPGTYREFLYIWKPLTLRGPNYDKRGDDAHRGPEAVLEYSYAAVGTFGALIYADADNVTVEGFDLRYPDSLIKNGHNSAVTFTDDGDLVTCNNHGFENGDVIMFSARATTTGISTYTYYFVINSTTDTFQLASTANGAALPLTNNGTGTIYGAGGSLWFSYALNNLVLRNNRMYGGEISIYIYFYTPYGNKTGGVIEGNYIDCGPFVNAVSNRAIYCSDLACTIQDNVIVNSTTGIQVSPYTNTTNVGSGTTPVPSLVQRNSISASLCGLYNNAHYNGGATVTWKHNTVTAAPNDRLGLKARVAGALTGLSAINGIWLRSMGVNATGTAPNVVFTNNVIDFTLDPAKTYNATTLRAVLYQDVHKTVTTTINNNSFLGWTVAARSQAANALAVSSSIDANLANNWWGTATAGKLVVESTVVSGSITVAPVLSGKTAGDGTVLLRDFNVPISSDVNYDNATSGLVATNVKAALDVLASGKVANGGNVASVRRLTQAEYDLIVAPDANTLYVIVG